jgi:hypothetical protein
METGDAASIPNVTDFLANLNPSYYFASRQMIPSGISGGGVWQYVPKVESARDGVGLCPRRII